MDIKLCLKPKTKQKQQNKKQKITGVLTATTKQKRRRNRAENTAKLDYRCLLKGWPSGLMYFKEKRGVDRVGGGLVGPGLWGVTWFAMGWQMAMGSPQIG